MSAVANDATLTGQWPQAEPQIKEVPRTKIERSTSHIENEPMTTRKRTTDETDDALDMNLSGFAEIMLRMNERSDERFARLIEATVSNRPNGRSWIAPAAAVFASIVAAVALLMNLTGAQYRSVSETNLIKDVAVLTEKLEGSERRQVDAQKGLETRIALLDERNRQMSIVLEARGIKTPQQ